jgi:hypothetical protein
MQPSNQSRIYARHLFWRIALIVALVGSLALAFLNNAAPHATQAATIQPGAQLTGALQFPDGFMKSVKDYGAKGDGVTDDTAAIQAALNDGRVDANGKPLYSPPDEYSGRPKALFFPAGVYRISNTVSWVGCCLTIQGQGSGATIIKLADGAPGFGDPAKPKPVIQTQDGNMAFRNHIWHMTVDTGKNNPGAVGVDYIASNHGSMRNVLVRSGDGQGVKGIDMTRKWPGPLMIKDVQVEGFDYGIDIDHGEYGVTLEGITLKNQRAAGLRCATNTVALRLLKSENNVPAIRTVGYNGGDLGLCTMVVLDSQLTGGDANVSAIENNGILYARNITTGGYQSAMRSKGTVIPGANVTEYVSKAERLFEDSPARSLNLPIQETPVFNDANRNNWAAVECTGYAPGCPVAPDLQKQLNSGKATIYFPFGVRQIYDEFVVTVPASVRRIVGFFGAINGGGNNGGGIKFVVEGDNAEPLIIEQFNYGVKIEHKGTRSVALKDGKYTYTSAPGAGALFLENVEVHRFAMHASQNVWARQFNNERDGETKITNDGGALWVFGIKTENTGTVLDNRNGAKSEMLGVHVYPASDFTPEEKQEPIFLSRDSSFSAIYAAISFSEIQTYDVQVEETRNGVTRKMLTKDAPLYYSRMGLFSGFREADIGQPPAATPNPALNKRVSLPLVRK